jgi:SET domain
MVISLTQVGILTKPYLVLYSRFFFNFITTVDRFLERPQLGPIPVKGDHAKAQQLYLSYRWKLIDKYKATSSQADLLHKELWETFVLDSAWKRNSRILAAFPPLTRNDTKNMEVYDEMTRFKSLIDYKKRQMVRSPEWLNEHGVCADTLRMIEPSTIRQAGRGVVANRFLAKGTVVLPVPLIPIPNRTILELQRQRPPTSNTNNNNDTKNGRSYRPSSLSSTMTHYQLLLNYCLGHAESSVLLSPYGPGFSLINHNQTLANVKLQWADPERSNHHPHLLQLPVKSLLNQLKRPTTSTTTTSTGHGGLAMEVVALRNIVPGEEIFLDYGTAWEAAWQNHVKHWNPVAGADMYRSAERMNQQKDLDTAFLLTVFDQVVFRPYPSNVVLKFNTDFIVLNPRLATPATTTTTITSKWMDCDILQWRKDKKFRGGLYTIVVRSPSTTTTMAMDGSKMTNTNKKNPGQYQLVKDVPREAFQFVNRPYTSDMLLPNAFRHDIRIPDEIFPERWKNLKAPPPQQQQRDGRRRPRRHIPIRRTNPRGSSRY